MNSYIYKIIDSFKHSIRADSLLNPFLKKESILSDITVVSIGKASNEMAKTALDVFSDQIKNGIIVCPDNCLDYQLNKLKRIESAHPFPDQRSIIAANELIELLNNNQNYILFLISGGGSSLIEKPVKNLSIDKLNHIIKKLMNKGADIDQINSIRKTLSLIKGGKLLSLINPDLSHVYILNDIISGNIENVSSGLTFNNYPNKLQIELIINDFIPEEKQNLQCFLDYPEFTSKSLPFTEIANFQTAIDLMAGILQENKYNVIKSPYILKDQASIAGLNIGCQAYHYKDYKQKPLAIVYGGETVVNVVGKGMGGRCLEMALATAIELNSLHDISFLSMTTDGVDGVAPSAGAIVDCHTIEKLLHYNFSPIQMLKENNTFPGLSFIKATIGSYKSQSNLNDIAVLFIE